MMKYGLKAPCNGDCKRREVGCHVTCQDYISYKEELEKRRQMDHEFKANNYWGRETWNYGRHKKYLTRY